MSRDEKAKCNARVDACILRSVGEGAKTFHRIMYWLVKHEARAVRLLGSERGGSTTDGVTDRRIQHLRREGHIRYTGQQTGWVLT